MFKTNIEQSGLKHIYSWYAKAMNKRRPGSSLSFESFRSHFVYNFYENNCFIFGNYKLGFILGYENNGFYVPSHFASRTMKGGVKLLSLFAKENVILAITDDLSKTLEKMSCYHFTDVIIPNYFRGELVQKYIWSSCPLAAYRIKKMYDNIIKDGEYFSFSEITWDDIINTNDFSFTDEFTYPYMNFDFITKPSYNVTNVYI